MRCQGFLDLNLAHTLREELAQMRAVLKQSLLGLPASMDPAWWRTAFAGMIAGAPTHLDLSTLNDPKWCVQRPPRPRILV